MTQELQEATLDSLPMHFMRGSKTKGESLRQLGGKELFCYFSYLQTPELLTCMLPKHIDM